LCIQFGEQFLGPCIDHLKAFCNMYSVARWRVVRAAQIARMRDQGTQLDEPVTSLVAFYSIMMYILAVLAARLQGLRYEITIVKKVFVLDDQVGQLSQTVFGALELLMSDCVLATEPSTTAILVTNNLFSMNCGALARGVVFKDFEIQIVSEETAENIQSEMNRARLLQQSNQISQPPSAALLAMKPTSGTKRSNAIKRNFVDSVGNTTHKKSDVNSKEYVTIYPVYNAKHRYWQATYPHLLCTTRQKGRQSTHNSFQDLSPSNPQNDKSNGKRPIFYFHIKATMFSPSGSFATAHNLSLPFTIATRRNQDCQVQRMMSSYTATIFWLYGCNHQEGLILQWVDDGMHWEQFKHLYKQHFQVNAGVQRGLIDEDFELLKYKLQCPDCQSGEDGANVNGIQQIVRFKNVLCPHLRYECGSTNVRFSVWRGMLELLQIFHDTRNNVRKLWEMGLLLGFIEFDECDKLLEQHKSALIMRLSFVTGGCDESVYDTNPDRHYSFYIDITYLLLSQVKYILNASHQVVRITEVLAQLGESDIGEGVDGSRDISSNVTHSGDIAAMQHIRFTAMRIAVVTCKVKPPSADQHELDSSYRIPPVAPPNDDFLRELVQLAAFHGKSRQVRFPEVQEIIVILIICCLGYSRRR
uniref:RUN domain-containing protein n=1 Tax=Angiostrongylus cantonensis TaxID=6313 RepID=A0A158PAP8_ANGCA